MLRASVLIEQPTRFRPTALFGFLVGEEMLDDTGDLLGIHMLQHITVGRHTRKACAWQLQRLRQVLLALAHPLGHST
jgi:hypothetical protein